MSRPKLIFANKDTIKYGDQTFRKQDCIDDLIAVNDTVANGTITRKKYREQGNIPEVIIEAFFGKWIDFQRAANMLPSRSINTRNSQIARSSASDRLSKYWAERRNWGEDYIRDSAGRHKTILGFNDLHDVECDPFLLRILIDVASRCSPDIIVSNGDHFDFPEYGKYPNDHREMDVPGRLRAGNSIFKMLREAAPNAQIDLIEGNHEARVIRWFSEDAPYLRETLADYHGWDLRKFMGLDENEVNYICKTDMKGAYTDANIKTEVKRNYQTYYDTVCAHHYPAGKDFGMAGWNGHHHFHQSWHFHNATYGAYEWHQFGAGHKRDCSYANGEKWSNGFGLIHIDAPSRLCQIEHVHVNSTMVVVGGKRYERREDEFYPALLPMTDKERVTPFPEIPTPNRTNPKAK
jgi:hypothetical protein